MSAIADGEGNTLRAMAMMLVATVAFTSMHAMIRHTAEGLHPFEVAFFRNLFGLVFLAPVLFRYGIAPLRTRKLKVHALRGVLNLASMLCFFYAITIAPFADVTALTFTAPIFASALAIVFLGERVGAVRWAAIVIGFFGAIVILRPGFGEIGLGPMLTVAAALLWALAMLVIKTLTRTESSLTITAYMMIVLAPMSFFAALPFWTWPAPGQYLELFILAALGTCGHLCLNQALKEGDTSLVSPVDYVRLVWAALIGYLAFGEVPDAMTWIGGSMICAGACFVAWHEGRRKPGAREGA